MAKWDPSQEAYYVFGVDFGNPLWLKIFKIYQIIYQMKKLKILLKNFKKKVTNLIKTGFCNGFQFIYFKTVPIMMTMILWSLFHWGEQNIIPLSKLENELFDNGPKTNFNFYNHSCTTISKFNNKLLLSKFYSHYNIQKT